MHPARVLRGPATLHRILPLRLGIQRLDHLGVLDVVSSARELHHLGQGKPPASRERACTSSALDLPTPGAGILRIRLRG